jgi:hypothetical protein
MEDQILPYFFYVTLKTLIISQESESSSKITKKTKTNYF